MNVLSLFDGMSCGQIALNNLGIKVDNYFASEIDKYAIAVTMHNYPNTKQLGSVIDVDGYKLPKIDLLIGGSPCQSFSFAGKRKGMSTKCETEILTLKHYLQLKAEGYEFEGQSYLFWEYMRLLNEVKPKYFLLENVMMSTKWKNILSKAIGVKPIEINSALVSAQNRRRLYWTNIGLQQMGLFGDLESIIPQPKDKGILIKDILESEVDAKYYLSKKSIAKIIRHANYFKIGGINQQYIIHNMMPRSGNPKKGGTGHLMRSDGKTYCLDTGNTNAVEILEKKPCLHEFENDTNKQSNKKLVRCGTIRRLTPVECERLQTVKDNYTKNVSDTQRYRMLGNGWTVKVVEHIFSFL